MVPNFVRVSYLYNTFLRKKRLIQLRVSLLKVKRGSLIPQKNTMAKKSLTVEGF